MTDTEIVNLAISHLGTSTEITSLATEASQEALVARRYYDIALDKVLGAFAWPFATRVVALALVQSAPTTEWDYSYRYPSDCLTMRRILSGTRNDTRQSTIPYLIASDASGRLIYTDEETAVCEYTKRITDTSIFPPDFTLAFSYYMASLMAPRITGGDQFKLGQLAYAQYRNAISEASAKAVNEQKAEELPESEYIRERS